ncbi:O-antigen translocase [uncultured Flavobacterium sp.]|uniref:O-antigen translocase n=1 Tax=uncultured Flavobacterium sp. TaxID=165435 RepID=UPI0025F7B6E3|nr:O-antigen translocase [uncultured Flavobacterium sp.]
MEHIRKIFKTNLFKVTSLNSVSVLVRMAGGFLASKMTAEFIGPGGMGIVGNLRNFLLSLDTFSTLGFQNGIIKYTAENAADQEKLYRTLATVFISILTAMIAISSILLVFSAGWSNWVFKNDEYSWLFQVLACSLPWYTGNLVFMAILNGLGRYKKVIGINIWGNVSGVLLSALLIWKLGVTGALLGLILYPALVFVFSFYLLYRTFPGFSFLKWKYFDGKLLKELFSYTSMAFVTTIFSSVVYISLRNMLRTDFSEAEAGFWEGINRISAFYFLFITTLLTLYFLPNLSKAKDDAETRSVLSRYYKNIIPLFALGLLMIYFFRKLVIQVILSDEFMPMENLFAWQLAGDLLKACSMILGFELLAKKATRTYIITEIISFTIMYVSGHYLIGLYGSEGAVMAHVLTNALYFTVLVIWNSKKLL